MKIAAKIWSLVAGNWLLVPIFFLLATSYLLLATISPVHAQGACEVSGNLSPQETINQINKCAIEKNIFDDKIFNLNQLSGTTDSLYTMLIGKSLLHPETDEVTQGKGAVAGIGRLVAGLYAVPPASGVTYFANEFQKFNPVQPAYAQAGTIGFDALQPVQKIWTAFRNMSYVGFVIIFVIIGFMIMFRAHISPQAVATVQDSIPRIVIALILVTFSYAIAGLMIDLMFLILNIFINLLDQSKLIDVAQANKVAFEKSVIGVIMTGWLDIVGTVAQTVADLIDKVVGLGKIGDLISWAVGGIGGLIFGIAMLFIMFRVFLMLLMAYVTIIILTMAAPFFFLVQALPGNNGAKEWFKQMAANVSVFPVVAIMFIFAGILGGIEALGGVPGKPVIESGQLLKFPLLAGGFDPETIGQLIGLGFLLMTPEAANLVKNFLGAKGPQFGGAIGAGIGAGAGALGGAGRWAAGGPFSRLADWRAERAIRRQTEISKKVWGTTGGAPSGGGGTATS